MNETGSMDAKEVATLDNQLGLTTVSVSAFNNQLKVDRQTNYVLSVVPPLMEPYTRQNGNALIAVKMVGIPPLLATPPVTCM